MNAKSTERRRHPRSRVLRRAQIVFRGGHVALGCVVLDLSAGGARLKVANWLAVPDTFELRLDNGPARLAEVRYRDMALTGVSFRDAA
jgi:hypothetical protein